MTDPLRLDIGFHDDVPAADYHLDPGANPTLSSSIAKKLVESTPRHAWIAHPRLNPNFELKDDSKFAIGSVTHELLLGRGAGFEIVKAKTWTTKDAKEARISARARRKTAVLSDQFDAALKTASSIVARLLQIEETRGLIAPGCAGGFRLTEGFGERVIIWRDIGGPLCRAMLDWHGPVETNIWDLKTTGVPLSDENLARLIVNLGYDMSAAFYLRGLSELCRELSGHFRWRWIFVEDHEPFEVRVIEPSAEMLAIGERKAALAILKWQICLNNDLWPGYPATVTRIDPPVWATDRWIARELADEDEIEGQ